MIASGTQQKVTRAYGDLEAYKRVNDGPSITRVKQHISDLEETLCLERRRRRVDRGNLLR